MGCLPLPLTFALGAGLGYLADRENGALWGAAAGIMIGLLASTGVILYLRRRR
ncbi:LPXTG cell wall anchor domain-containing protein [Frateuria aurantia]|uniref:Uncharacterized protein n=1 Tax=Frateuria aurantia (strain ATCC 33424 / DSM 6220 / KCTC 2777 / LMG 1558 / NBRC 3245 / NCIMB 13370) TaxID=767434 RepID=H8L3J3_FRAAD|nr:LPXTG cell wall anchor domain-containing protein [Frateuria aurantia]AFC87362.1 hypothetical protein Fraau_3034 [Frateuria aurantia DSM 6220]